MRHPTDTDSARGRKLTGATIIGLFAVAAIGIGACSAPAASSIPTLPSLALPSVDLPTLPPAGSPVAACIDSATMAILQQLQAPGADIAGLIATNKDALVSGLQSMQPADAASTAWRDGLLAAVQSGDAATVTTQVAALVSSQVTLTTC